MKTKALVSAIDRAMAAGSALILPFEPPASDLQAQLLEQLEAIERQTEQMQLTFERVRENAKALPERLKAAMPAGIEDCHGNQLVKLADVLAFIQEYKY